MVAKIPLNRPSGDFTHVHIMEGHVYGRAIRKETVRDVYIAYKKLNYSALGVSIP